MLQGVGKVTSIASTAPPFRMERAQLYMIQLPSPCHTQRTDEQLREGRHNLEPTWLQHGVGP
jgi:hypothetical protein